MQYIGIDAGGTKTKFALFDECGKLLKEHTLPSCHVMQVSDEKAIAILKEGIMSLSAFINDEVKIICGMAGYGKNIALRKRIERNCQEAFSFNYEIYSDIEIALAGALGKEKGITVISGTGSIALSNLYEKITRCGGWGYKLGDEGSAYWIGKKVLETFTKMSDNRLPKTYLYQLIKQECGLDDDYDLISFINDNGDRDQIAKLALLAYKAACEHDENALMIYDLAAYEISLLIKALAKDIKQKIIVSGIGGVFNSKEIIFPLLEKYCGDQFIFKKPAYPPEYGAYLLGKK